MDTAESSKKSLIETFNMVKLRQLNELRKENEFCDLILKSEDGFEIKVHKNVVSSASNYFKDLLTLSMREKFEESITLQGITADVLKKIITFIYTSEFEQEIEDIDKIIKYAAIFQLEQLVEICSLALSESMTDDSCLKYWRLGGDNLIYSLEAKCLSYIVGKADYLFDNSLMRDLTIEEMRSLLSDNRLHLQCDEKRIFEHVWKWAEGEASETKNFSQVFSEVVDLLHFSKLDNEFVFQKMFDNEDVLVNAELLKKVAKLSKQKYIDDFTENGEILPKIAKLSKPPDCEDEVASRHIFNKPTQQLIGLTKYKMFIGLGEESTIEKEIKPRFGFGYTTFDSKLLICGGEVEGRTTNACELFDSSTLEWAKFPSMKEERIYHQCSYLDNKIYACGGRGQKTVEIFDFAKGEWDYGPEMFNNNWNFGLTRANGALYVIGGLTKLVEILDPRTQKWNFVLSEFQFRDVRIIAVGSCIYCFTKKNRYVFDTRSNKFTEEICCKHFEVDFNYCELDGYIYGFGYQEDAANKYSLDLVQYDPDGKQRFKKSYGLYNWAACKSTAIVSLYYQ